MANHKEIDVTFDTEDSNIIYGTHNTFSGNRKLAIIIHGLTGNMGYHLFYNAAHFFPEKGFDILRVNLYDWREKGRKLKDCNMDTHSDDIKVVIEKMKKAYDHIFLIGHSLGGPSVFSCDKTEISGLVGRDPTLLDQEMVEEFGKSFVPINEYFYGDWNIQPLMSKKLIDQWGKLDNRTRNNVTKPTLIITAPKGVLHNKRQGSDLPENFTLDSVPGASHSFDEKDTAKKLYNKTLKRFNSLKT